MDRRSFLILACVGLIDTSLTRGNVITTWVPKDFDCPICKTKNTFRVWASYGNYIYAWPSKYQWVFWPWTDPPSVYLCKKCHVASFMDDYEGMPKDKLAVIEKELTRIPFTHKFKDYLEVPMTERLEIAEKVYRLLRERDDSFWCWFYRVKGYHYGTGQKADESRTKALELTRKMMSDPKAKAPMKELLYISGAMKHFLRDDKGALEDFKKGLDTKFVHSASTAEDADNAEKGMNERFNDYIKQIASAKPPRSFHAN